MLLIQLWDILESRELLSGKKECAVFTAHSFWRQIMLIFSACGILLAFPELYSDLAGLAILAIGIGYYYISRKLIRSHPEQGLEA